MAEKEYIEREAVIAYMSEVKAACISNFEYEASAVIEGMIGEIKDDEIPAADVVPVQHGRWIMHDDELGLTCECSVCHIETMGDGNYCPNCGAKMDGGTQNV